jgi:hypothetical protein
MIAVRVIFRSLASVSLPQPPDRLLHVFLVLDLASPSIKPPVLQVIPAQSLFWALVDEFGD